jgi:hypothetical protein
MGKDSVYIYSPAGSPPLTYQARLGKEDPMSSDSNILNTAVLPNGPWPPPRVDSRPWPPPRLVSTGLVAAVIQKRTASRLLDGQMQRELSSAADRTIDELVDEFCGTPPRPLPVLMLASELAAFAEDLEEGGLRTTILEETSRIVQRAFGGASKTAGAGSR